MALALWYWEPHRRQWEGGIAVALYAFGSLLTFQGDFWQVALAFGHLTLMVIFTCTSVTVLGWAIAVVFWFLFGADILLFLEVIERLHYVHFKGAMAYVLMAFIAWGSYRNDRPSLPPYIRVSGGSADGNGRLYRLCSDQEVSWQTTPKITQKSYRVADQ